MWDAIRQVDFQNVNLPGANGRRPYHFQFLINPYESANEGFFTIMYHEPTCPAGSSPPQPSSRISTGDSAAEVVSFLTDVFGGITGDLTTLFASVGYGDYANVCGTPGQMFRDTTTRGNAASTAMGVPLDRLKEAVEIAAHHVAESDAPALVAVRLVKASKATLAFTRHEDVTAVVEVDGPESNRMKQAYRAIWQAYVDANIPYTFHWGKLNNLDSASVRGIYGPAVDKWLEARDKLLPTPELKRVFANDLTDQLGLSD